MGTNLRLGAKATLQVIEAFAQLSCQNTFQSSADFGVKSPSYSRVETRRHLRIPAGYERFLEFVPTSFRLKLIRSFGC